MPQYDFTQKEATDYLSRRKMNSPTLKRNRDAQDSIERGSFPIIFLFSYYCRFKEEESGFMHLFS